VAAKILDGKAVARTIRSEVATEVADFRRLHGTSPRLAAIRVGDDPASRIYVKNKITACSEVGIRSAELSLPATVSQKELLGAIRDANADPDLDGILLQLPLPMGLDRVAALIAIDPIKDVDGLHPMNAGRLMMGLKAPVPCTPAGIVELLVRSDLPIAGRRAVIVGRSDIVGRPLALLLMRRDATVTICHSKTRDLPSVTLQADILVAAMGKPSFLRAEHIGPGATVIDVGINRVDDADLVANIFGADSPRIEQARQRGYTLVGDVHPVEAGERAGHLTPVPGGIGPLTIACLLRNTLGAARARREAANVRPSR
jgi:methylenetetrahydrofolate dehydrogenase (NADP+)/methenyltetrahydrofolate cyclohydrolase